METLPTIQKKFNSSNDYKETEQKRFTNKESRRFQQELIPINPSCQKMPISMSAAFRSKYSNDIRKDFVNFVAEQEDLDNANDSVLLEKFAKQRNLNYKESNNRLTRTYLRQTHLGMENLKQGKSRYVKPNLRYFNPDDSFVKQEELDRILKRDQRQNAMKESVRLMKAEEKIEKQFKEKFLDKMGELQEKSQIGNLFLSQQWQ